MSLKLLKSHRTPCLGICLQQRNHRKTNDGDNKVVCLLTKLHKTLVTLPTSYPNEGSYLLIIKRKCLNLSRLCVSDILIQQKSYITILQQSTSFSITLIYLQTGQIIKGKLNHESSECLHA